MYHLVDTKTVYVLGDVVQTVLHRAIYINFVMRKEMSPWHLILMVG